MTANLWKADKTVSITQEFWKCLGQFVKIRSMKKGLPGFLKHVALFTILVRLKLEQKFLTDESLTPALKSPKKRSWSYLLRYRSMFLLNSARWFDVIAFLGLYELLSSHFFLLRRFIYTKKPSILIFIGKSFDGMFSLIINKMPPNFHPCQNGKVRCNRLIKTDLEGNFDQVFFLIS